ncbi:MAG: hypothetical protein QW639_06685, partial [Candidatus Bathyarchaeia archaeon]
MKTRDIALIAVFAALWVTAETTLGPWIGRFRIGLFSLHGMVNRVVGWMSMLIVAEVAGRFGRASMMSLVAAMGTRIIRISPLEGLLVGAGYALGGLIFDILFFTPLARRLGETRRRLYLLLASTISGALAIAPYLAFKLWILGLYPFIALSPTYAISTIKGILFNIVGTSL